MKTTDTTATVERTLSQFSQGFKLFVKGELIKELSLLNPSLTTDPDKIYVNVAQGTTISFETLTETLLKSTLHETTLLSNPSAGLYVYPKSIDKKDQIKGLNPTDLKNTIDRLSTTIVNTYNQQIDNFWNTEKLSVPLELQPSATNEILKALAKSISLIEKAYQIDSMYPNLKQGIVTYFSKKLKDLYNKYIHPSTVNILFFVSQEKDRTVPFSTLNLINFTLNKLTFNSYPPDAVTVQARVGQDAENIALSVIFQESDLLAIQSSYQAKQKLFWHKNFNNYRVLAKFSFLRALFEQQNSLHKLSEKGFALACQVSLGLKQEEIRELDEMDTHNITNLEALFAKNPLDVSLLISSQLEISLFPINNQQTTDILKVQNLKTNNALLYLPGYTPSFVEAKHDVSLYPDDIPQEKGIVEEANQEDIFSFITRKQSSRSFADLSNRIPIPLDPNSTARYRSTDSAVFATIAKAVEYVPYLLPNIHNTSNDLYELLPTPYRTASDLMKKRIREKLHLDIDPDRTFIRFSLNETGPIYYDPTMPAISRKQKASTTIQSLTEAALYSYRAGYSPFGYTTTIYQDPSGKGEYTSSDQLLNISPQDVEEIIRQVDLKTLHKNKLTEFWTHRSDQVKRFLKHRYLQQALEAYHNKILSKESFKVVTEVAFYSLALDEGEAPSFINPNLRIEIISVEGYQSTDMFLFLDTSQQEVILYIAGNKQSFFTFATHKECINYLETAAKKNLSWQEIITSHFSMDVQDSVLSRLQRGSYTSILNNFSLLPSCQPKGHCKRHPMATEPIKKSLFEMLLKNIQERSYLDANVLITSDQEIMLKHMVNIVKCIEILLLLPSIASPILNWVTLAALITETSLNFYIANNSDTVKERHQAAIEAGFDAVESLLVAFLSVRSLKFSKSQSLSNTEQEAIKSRPITRGSSSITSSLRKGSVSDEAFFNTTKSMRVWNISAIDPQFKHLDAKAWFLDDRFLLFTGKTEKANHLIISSHGGYFPGSGTVKVPQNTELAVLGPHGLALTDPRTAALAKGLILPYGIINQTSALPTQTAFLPSLFSRSPNTHIHPDLLDVKMLAGTTVPGHIRNYSLDKYQGYGLGQENYLDLVRIVNHSRHPAPNIYQIGVRPVDILTVRNRRGRLLPDLKDVFASLEKKGIHYDRITLEFCRTNMLLSRADLLSYKPARLI